MGKVIELIKLTNFLDPSKSIEVDALVDTGATMLVLPQNLINQLGLRKLRETKVRYANGAIQVRSIYGVVTVEIQGRAGEFNALEGVPGIQPFVGQTVLEQLDLVVHPAKRKLAPNPESPDMPTVEVL